MLPTAGEAFEQIFNAKYGAVDRVYGIASASTDFVGILSFVVAPHAHALRLTNDPLHQGDVTYGILGSDVLSSRVF
jgi:hypothetical protein